MKLTCLLVVFVLIISCNEAPKTEIPSKQKHSLEFIIEHYKNPTDDFVIVVAHRADWRNFPENSLEAIRSAIDMGVDMVEIDIRKTKDGSLILMHDETYDRTTDGAGSINEKTLSEVRSLTLRSGIDAATEFKVPTLREALLECKGKIMINLDKAEDYITDIYPILKETNTLHQVVLKGHHTPKDFEEKFGAYAKDILYMPLITNKIHDIPAYVNTLEDKLNPSSYEVIINPEFMAGFEYIPTIKANKDNVWINTLWASLSNGRTDDNAYWHPDENWGWVIENGATIIQTDRPKELLQYLKSIEKH